MRLNEIFTHENHLFVECYLKCIDIKKVKLFCFRCQEDGEEDLAIDTPEYTLTQVAEHLKV